MALEILVESRSRRRRSVRSRNAYHAAVNRLPSSLGCSLEREGGPLRVRLLGALRRTWLGNKRYFLVLSFRHKF